MRPVLLAVVTFAVTLQTRPLLAQRPRRALELATQVGYGHVLGKWGERSYEMASQNGGALVAVAIAYRTPYLFVPWVELGWAELQWSREAPKTTEFADEAASVSSLTTSYLQFGPSVEEGMLRFRAGTGLYRQQVSSSFSGQTIHPVSWDVGYSLAYGVRAHDGPRYGWGLEAMGLLMSESQIAYFGIALRVWGNPWSE